MHRPTWLRRLALLVTVFALFAAACGSDDDGVEAAGEAADSEDETESPSPSEEPAAAFPVTIEHLWGSATIEEEPERIVTLGVTDADAVLAMGITPVALTGYVFFETGLGPWATPLIEGEPPELLTGEPNIEHIAALQPDLIIAISAGFEEPVYEQLSGIAPTVVRPAGTDAYQVSRDDATRLIGTALGQPERAEELVDEANARIEEAAADHPEFQDMTGVVVLPYDGKYGAYTERDARGRFMTELGFELPPALAELDTEDDFYIEVSQERAGLLDADVVVMLADAAEAREAVDGDVVLQNVPAVADGRMVIPDTDTRGAITYNTVLSVPFALDELVPQLVAVSPGA